MVFEFRGIPTKGGQAPPCPSAAHTDSPPLKQEKTEIDKDKKNASRTTGVYDMFWHFMSTHTSHTRGRCPIFKNKLFALL